MSEWFVYQPGGRHIGPVSTEALARGLAMGMVPRDAHVAHPGGASWQVVTAVSEIAAAIASQSPHGPVSPPVPAAPPPRMTLPPSARAVALPPPAALESTLPSKKPKPAAQGGAPRAIIPVTILGGSFLLAAAVAIASMLLLPKEGESVPARSIVLNAALLLTTLATLSLPPESARARVVTSAIVLVATAAHASGGSLFMATCVTQSVSVALSALILRFSDRENHDAADRAYLVAWGLVPGAALLGWVLALFRVV